MLDVAYPLRAKYYELLHNNVVYDSAIIPVFSDYASITSETPYIVIGDVDESPVENKCHFGDNIRVTLDVVTEYPTASNAGRTDSEKIMGLCMSILLPSVQNSGPVFDLEDFQVISAKKVLGRSIQEQTNNSKIFRKILIINHSIKQLSNG